MARRRRRLRAAHTDLPGALVLLSTAEQCYNSDFSPLLRPVSAVTARMRLAAGDVDGTARWAAGSGLSTDDEPAYLREYEHLTLAGELIVSLTTVRTHTKNIFLKLGVTNRRSAIRRAHELGL